MLSEYTKFKLNRQLRKLKRQSRKHTDRLETHTRINIVRRWRRLRPVRGFVIAWWGTCFLALSMLVWQSQNLAATFKQLQPASGGTYAEGLVGKVDNINPIFSLDGPNAAAAKLIFNGLMKYDNRGRLTEDLAQTMKVDDNSSVYTVSLRENIRWHDGRPLTAEDVVFTFTSIQHPDTRSPLNASWRDISIKALDDLTVEFTLPNAFSPFPHSLTTGILPKHRLEDLGAGSLRAAEFNQAPTGTGPFKFSRLDAAKGELSLVAYDRYFKGRPKLDRFVIQTYDNFEDAVEAYRSGVITALSDVPSSIRPNLEENVRNRAVIRDTATSYGTYAFYNNSHPVLKDKKVRRALTAAISHRQLLEALEYEQGLVRGPLLPSQLGYDSSLLQPRYSVDRARRLMDEAGWRANSEGLRTKNGQALKLTIITQDGQDYDRAAQTVRSAWREIGVDAEVKLLDAVELQQSHIRTHDYDVLIYAIDLGADPDVFVYWHSSQIKAPQLNLSEYKSSLADEALESGRTRSDRKLRIAKYKTFLEAWREDVPAAGLYNRYLAYAQHPDVRTFENQRFITPTDRFNNVENWTVRLERR